LRVDFSARNFCNDGVFAHGTASVGGVGVGVGGDDVVDVGANGDNEERIRDFETRGA
jgi:hypothetical protein